MGRLSFIVIILFLLLEANAKLLRWPIQQKRAIAEENMTNLHGQSESGYYVTIEIGTPAQKIEVIIDTGSSNLAVAGTAELPTNKFYKSDASTTADDSNSFHVETVYTEGSWQGTLLYDVVAIPSAQIFNPVHMPVTEITSAKKFFIMNSNWQGIMGLGYSSLVQPTGNQISSVVELIISESKIKNVFSLQLCSNPLNDDIYGSLIFGGFDARLSTGEMLWTNIVREWYYEVIITEIMVGDTKVDLPCSALNDDKTIVDSGTTNLRLPTLVYQQVLKLIQDYVKPQVFDDDFYNASKVYCTSESDRLHNMFPLLHFSFPSSSGNTTITLTIHPSSYIQFVHQDQESAQICFKFVIYPSMTGAVLGTVVMEKYYVVFDRENKKIGFAKSTCSGINSSFPFVRETWKWTDPASCHSSTSGHNSEKIVLYVLVGIIAFFALVACACLIMFYTKKRATRGLCCCKEPASYSELNDL